MCVKVVFFLLINFHIRHYFAVNLLCIRENESEEHNFFPFCSKRTVLQIKWG